MFPRERHCSPPNLNREIFELTQRARYRLWYDRGQLDSMAILDAIDAIGAFLSALEVI